MGRFRIRIAPTWFSDDYVYLKYSNNGVFWKTVKGYTEDRLDKWCYWEKKAVKLTDAEHWISRFKTIDEVKIFEEEQLKLGIDRNKELSEEARRKQKEKDKIYKLYG